MAGQKRTIIDDVIEGVRQVYDELDRLLNPDKRKRRAPVPVPVPVRHDERNYRYPRQ